MTIRGIARDVQSHRFTLQTTKHGSYAVALTSDTLITQKGIQGRLSVHEGNHVGVRGFLKGRAIRAISVRIYPIKPKPYTLQGRVTAMDGSSITVTAAGKSTRVTLTAGTKVSVGSRTGSARDIRVGDRVRVRIQKGAHGAVALNIHVYSRQAAAQSVQVGGTVIGVTSGSVSVRSGNVTYHIALTAQTRVYVGADFGSISSLHVGQTVRVYACCAGQPLTARSVHIRKTTAPRPTLTVSGRIIALSAVRLTLTSGTASIVVFFNRSTRYELGTERIPVSGLRIGDSVSVRAYRQNGALIATRVHVYSASRQMHTITGVVVATSSGRLTVRARGKTYVVLASQAVITLSGQRVAVASIHVGDRVKVVGQVVGTTVTAGSIAARRVPPKIVRVSGTVTQINGSVMIIVDAAGGRHTVRLASGAHPSLAGKPAPADALFPGVHATARGAMSGRVLVASSLALTVQSRLLSGRLLHVTASTLLLARSASAQVTVDIPRTASISDGQRHVAAAALHAGAYARVSGYAESSSRVRASAVHVLHPSLDITGTVTTVAGALTVRTSQGEDFRLAVTSATSISSEYGQISLTAADIPSGIHVHVQGTMRSDGALRATELIVRLASLTLRGHITAMSPNSLTVATGAESLQVRLGEQIPILQGSRSLTSADLVAGDDVTVYGYQLGPGRAIARRIAVHRSLVGLDGTVSSLSSDGFVLATAGGAIRIITSSTTDITGGAPVGGARVHVTGYRRGDGVILATKVRVGKSRAYLRHRGHKSGSDELVSWAAWPRRQAHC